VVGLKQGSLPCLAPSLLSWGRVTSLQHKR